MAQRIGDSLSTIDQTKDTAKKRLPTASQLNANANPNAGGAGGTAAAGSNNMQVGRQGTYTLPTQPALASTPIVPKQTSFGRGFATVTPGSSQPPGDRAYHPATVIPTPSATPIVPVTPSLNPPSALASNITSNPMSMIDSTGNNVAIPTITNVNGVKTLSVGGGTVSSSSPKFGNSSDARLGDLNRTLINDMNPDIKANRAESARLADERYAAVREQNNPLSAINLLKSSAEARAAGDIPRFIQLRDLLEKQVGNEANVTKANIDQQSEMQRLGQTAMSDQVKAAREDAYRNSTLSLDQQKAQASIQKDVNDYFANPINMAGEHSPSQSFEIVNRLGGDVGKSADNILGPQTANEFRQAPLERKVQLLVGAGLSPEQIKEMINRTSQQ